MMKKATIFALIFLIININPVNANEECTSLTEEQIQSSIDKVVEGKTPSEVSVEAIINQINEEVNKLTVDKANLSSHEQEGSEDFQ